MTDSQKPKLCKDCKHCIPDRSWWWWCPWNASSFQWRFSRCRHTAKPRYPGDGHRFTGERYKEKWDHRYCASEREKGYQDENPCGPEGQYFEAKR